MKMPNSSWKKLFALAFLIMLISPFASLFPDGLEWSAEQLGFIGKAHTINSAPLVDYNLSSISNSYLSTSVAGLIGIFLILGVFYLPRTIKRIF